MISGTPLTYVRLDAEIAHGCSGDVPHPHFSGTRQRGNRCRGSAGAGPAEPENPSKLNILLEEVRASFSPTCAGGEDRMVPSVARKAQRVSFKLDVPPDEMRAVQ